MNKKAIIEISEFYGFDAKSRQLTMDWSDYGV